MVELANCACREELVEPGRRVGKKCRAKAEQGARIERRERLSQRSCAVAGCTQSRVVTPSQVLSYCQDHRVNRPTSRRVAPPGMKYCPRCEKDLPLDEFGLVKGKPDTVCREHRRLIQRDHDARRPAQRMTTKRNSARVRRMAAYLFPDGSGGWRPMTDDDFDNEFIAQHGICAAPGCDFPFEYRAPDIDHDHVTMRYRGLLCPACNKGVGMFRDDPNRLRGMAAYIESHRITAEIEEQREREQ